MRRTMTLLAALAMTLAIVPAASAQSGDDEHRSLQWGLDQVNAEEAWATSTGTGQTIAVVDSGVDLSHPDLASKIVGGATFHGCADEAGGCGDGDWRSGGDEGDPHGTHVAGIAAAVTGNGTGIAGAAPDAGILAVKVLGPAGGSFEEVAAGIRWAADNGADVINLSLGGLPGLQALEITGLLSDAADAIDYAYEQGVVVVAAAGNEAFPLCGSPGFNGNALCVTATDRDELKAWYSNFLSDEALNIVAAPGGAGTFFCADDVISTVPAGSEGFCGESEGTPGYDFYAGTSMAAPHVAGIAALLTAQGRDVAEVFDVLTSTSRTPVAGTRGVYTPTHGWGIVDAAAAVAAPLSGGGDEGGDGGDGGGNGNNGNNGKNDSCRGNGKHSC